MPCSIHKNSQGFRFPIEIKAADGSDGRTEEVRLCHGCLISQMQLFIQAMSYTARIFFVEHIRSGKLYLSDVPAEWRALEPSVKTMEMIDGFPRRNRHDLHTPAERAITEAMYAVEEAGTDPKLTAAIIKLSEARDLVADFVESHGKHEAGRHHVPAENEEQKLLDQAKTALSRLIERSTDGAASGRYLTALNALNAPAPQYSSWHLCRLVRRHGIVTQMIRPGA